MPRPRSAVPVADLDEPVIRAAEVRKSYGGDVALAAASLVVGPREFVAVMGRSGSGKSTLLRILAGIETPDSGQVTTVGHRLDRLGERARSRLRLSAMGFVFQSADLVPELSLRENVALPLEVLGTPRQQARDRADRLLAAFDVPASAGRRVGGEVSGGQLQRAAVARAVITEPAVVFADEPTGALDTQNGEAVMQALLRLRDHGSAVVLVTHDRALGARADRVVEISDGTTR